MRKPIASAPPARPAHTGPSETRRHLNSTDNKDHFDLCRDLCSPNFDYAEARKWAIKFSITMADEIFDYTEAERSAIQLSLRCIQPIKGGPWDEYHWHRLRRGALIYLQPGLTLSLPQALAGLLMPREAWERKVAGLLREAEDMILRNFQKAILVCEDDEVPFKNLWETWRIPLLELERLRALAEDEAKRTRGVPELQAAIESRLSPESPLRLAGRRRSRGLDYQFFVLTSWLRYVGE